MLLYSIQHSPSFLTNYDNLIQFNYVRDDCNICLRFLVVFVETAIITISQSVRKTHSYLILCQLSSRQYCCTLYLYFFFCICKFKSNVLFFLFAGVSVIFPNKGFVGNCFISKVVNSKQGTGKTETRWNYEQREWIQNDGMVRNAERSSKICECFVLFLIRQNSFTK